MSAKRGIEFLKGAAEFMVKTNSFDSVTRNVIIRDGGEGRCVAELTLTNKHLNTSGTLHIGLTMTIVDLVTTYALMSCPSPSGLSTNLHVCMLKEAKEGEVLVIEANTVKAGGNIAHIVCEFRRKSDDELIARGDHTKYIDLKSKI